MSDLIQTLRDLASLYADEDPNTPIDEFIVSQAATEIEKLQQRIAEAESKLPRWIPVGERMPKDKKPIYMIALVPERNYTTDQYAGWYTLGKWTRWPHRLPPTHWSYQIDNPEGDL